MVSRTILGKLELSKSIQKGKAVRVHRMPGRLDIINNIFKCINTALIRRRTVIINNFGKFTIVRSNIKGVYDFKLKKRIPWEGKYKIIFKAAPAVERLLNERNKRT